MLMIQTLNATAFIGGALGALLVKWGQWMKEQPKGAPRWPYFHENLGELMSSTGILGLVMVLWLSGNLGWFAKKFADVLPLGGMTFGEQITVAAWSSFGVGFVAELLAPTLLIKVLGWLGVGKKAVPVVALLLAGHAHAEEPKSFSYLAKHGTWYATASYFQVGDFEAAAEPPCLPALHVSTDDTHGFTLGAGYQWPSGWSLDVSWLRMTQDVSSSLGSFSTSWGASSNGFMVSGKMPLRFLSPCHWGCK